MSRVLVVTAIDVETRGLARRLRLRRRRNGPGLRYGNAGLEVACAGPGARNLERLDDLGRTATLVVSAGTCGALAPHLGAGALVAPDRVLASSGPAEELARCARLHQAGALLTVDRVVETAREKTRLWRDTGALAVDMESAVIARWAAARGLPVVAIRGVADSADHGVPAAFAEFVDAEGRTRIGRALGALCRRPDAVGRALRLRRDTAAALGTVAAALGDLAAAWAAGEGLPARPAAPVRG